MTRDVLSDYPRVEAHVEVDDAVAVSGQQSALRRVLVNLLDNAGRHARSQVALTVELTSVADAPAVRFVVADDGPGIPPDERELVFDRFYRVDHARARDDGGTGLGLAIVRDVVAAHHGTIVLEDNDPGLRAVVTVPLA